MQLVGREDAASMLELEEGLSFDLLEQYHSSADLRKEHLSFSDYFTKFTQSLGNGLLNWFSNL